MVVFCSLLGLSSVGVAQPPDIRQGLVAYWPLDGTDGAITPDATPFGHHLSLVGMDASSFVPGRFGQAASFNGSSTYLRKDHGPEDYPATGMPIYRASRYTITMWVKGPAQTGKYLFTEGSTLSNNPLLILQTGQAAANNAKFDVIIRTDGGATLLNHVVSSNVVFDNTWHHIAWVDDAGQARLYVDGELDPANFNYGPSGTFTFNTTALGALIRASVSGYFNGLIDDVAVWERVLSQEEIRQVMNNSLVTPIPEFPPYIAVVPTNVTRQVGDRASFIAHPVGNRPLNMQWYRGTEPIPEATGPTLTLSNLTVADSGTYTFEVQNLDGIASASAELTVLPDPEPDLQRGLIHYWPLEEQEYDDLGNLVTPDLYSHNDLRLVNMDLGNEVPGVFGTAYVFDGSSEYAYRVGGAPVYNNPAFSIALWFNINGVGQSDRRFFAESSTVNNNPLFCFGTHATGADGRIRVYIRAAGGTVLLDRYTTRAPLDGTWHHFVWTETNGQARLYIDGELDATDFTYTRGTLTLSQTVLGAIVRAAVSHWCAGMLDEVAVWNRPLTWTEIQLIRTNGVPPPVAAIPPQIVQHPVSQSVLTGGQATFSFLATGTAPLFAQWRKDGVPLPDQTNDVLRLTGVTFADAGDYDVVVTNVAGSVTSQVARLTVTLRPPPPERLQIDFNHTGAETPADTEPGFDSFALPAIGVGPFTRSYGGADLTVEAVGAIMESRKRTTPTNWGDFTQEKLLTDFIFTRDATPDQGLDLLIEFMKPNTPYTVTIWSFDTASVGNYRISDWYANGQLVRSGWSFIGSELPTSNDRYQFSFDTTSDAHGTILIQGRRSASAAGSINVFINALRIVPREIRIVRIELMPPDSLLLTIQGVRAAAQYRVEEKLMLSDPEWVEVPDAAFGPLTDDLIQAVVPLPSSATRFYRVVEVP